MIQTPPRSLLDIIDVDRAEAWLSDPGGVPGHCRMVAAMGSRPPARSATGPDSAHQAAVSGSQRPSAAVSGRQQLSAAVSNCRRPSSGLRLTGSAISWGEGLGRARLWEPQVPGQQP